MTSSKFVIIGAGLAGAKAAEALRGKGFDGEITVIGKEKHLPYERPPLSKDYLAGKAERGSVFVHDQAWYAEHNVDLQRGTTATSIDRANHQVELADGTRLRYDKLLLATGSSPKRLPSAPGVRYLRDIDDCDQLKQAFTTGSRLVVIGAGWLGLETAAAARQAGLTVTVLERQELPLLRDLGSKAAQIFANLHLAHGVDLRPNVQVEKVTELGAGVTSVQLTDGSQLHADVVLVAIGATPNTQLAEAADLAVNDGVVVDASLRSSDPDIFAVGDIANAYHPFLDRHIRIEHWATALNQPAVAAAGMLGNEEQYDELPYCYTDQYNLGMEYIGDIHDHDQVVFRGDQASGEFIVFWLKNNRVCAGMNINVWEVVDPIKALIRSKKPLDTRRLADRNVPLEELIAS